MARKEGDNEDIKPDMTPMIDVTFQLLIFFILTMKMKKEEGKLEAFLPKDKGQRAVQHVSTTDDLEDIRIKIVDKGVGGTVEVLVGSTSLGVTDSSARRMAIYETLVGTLRGLRSEGMTRPVVIDGEPTVHFDHVISVLNASIKAGFKEINFTVPEIAYQWQIMK